VNVMHSVVSKLLKVVSIKFQNLVKCVSLGFPWLEHFNWLFKLVEHVLTNQVYFAEDTKLEALAFAFIVFDT